MLEKIRKFLRSEFLRSVARGMAAAFATSFTF